MKRIRKHKYGERGFSMGNMLLILAIAGTFYVVKGQLSEASLNGKHTTQVVKELGQPVAKESIPRPS